MPSNLLAIDADFPTFTGEEPEKEQIQELTNYLYQLRESLQYSLQNLSKSNFNAAALNDLTSEATQGIEKMIKQLDDAIIALQRKDADMGQSIALLKENQIIGVRIVEIQESESKS